MLNKNLNKPLTQFQDPYEKFSIFLENNNSFSTKEWKELYRLSEETFVEETESLKKKGAGAGLTDND